MNRNRQKLRFVIVANGFASGPSQALEDFLKDQKVASIEVLQHPLVAESGRVHLRKIWTPYKAEIVTRTRRYNRPPLTYTLDFFTPIRIAKSDIWFSFNPLATLQGLIYRKVRKTSKVVHWSVDFVPKRFNNRILNFIYKTIDKICCEKCDLRVELSQTALDNRNEQFGLSPREISNVVVLPMGFWASKVPICTVEAWQKKEIIFLGHLVERMGLETLIESCRILHNREVTFHLNIIGSGPLYRLIEEQVKINHLTEKVTLLGFVESHSDLAAILSNSAIGLAPYADDPDSFTRFADPGKIKDYLGAGLPIVMTRVPPNALELSDHAGTTIVQDNPNDLADAIERLLGDYELWSQNRNAALTYRLNFSWTDLFESQLGDFLDTPT